MLASLKAVLDALLSLRKVKREEADDKIAILIEPLQRDLDTLHESCKASFKECLEALDDGTSFRDLPYKLSSKLELDIALADDIRRGLLRKAIANFKEFAPVAAYLKDRIEPYGVVSAFRNPRYQVITDLVKLERDFFLRRNPEEEEEARVHLRKALLARLKELQEQKDIADVALTKEKARLRGIGKLR